MPFDVPLQIKRYQQALRIISHNVSGYISYSTINQSFIFVQ